MNLPNFGGIFELKASYIGSYSSFSIPLLELLPSASQLYQHELKASYIGSYSSFSIPLLEQLPSASHAMPGSEFCSLTVIRCQVEDYYTLPISNHSQGTNSLPGIACWYS